MRKPFWLAVICASVSHASAPHSRTTTRVHGPEDFIVGKEVCASFTNNDLRMSQVLNDFDIREFVTRLENGGQTYSYLFNVFCDPNVPMKRLMEDAFICCTMRPARNTNPSIASSRAGTKP